MTLVLRGSLLNRQLSDKDLACANSWETSDACEQGVQSQCGSACFVFTAFFPKLLALAGRWTPSCLLPSTNEFDRERTGQTSHHFSLDEFLMFGGMSCHWSFIIEAKSYWHFSDIYAIENLQLADLTNFFGFVNKGCIKKQIRRQYFFPKTAFCTYLRPHLMMHAWSINNHHHHPSNPDHDQRSGIEYEE